MASKNYQELAINRVLKAYYQSSQAKHLSLGQWFVLKYLDTPWPALFFAEDDGEAVAKIAQWLRDGGYTKRLPKATELPGG